MLGKVIRRLHRERGMDEMVRGIWPLARGPPPTEAGEMSITGTPVRLGHGGRRQAVEGRGVAAVGGPSTARRPRRRRRRSVPEFKLSALADVRGSCSAYPIPTSEGLIRAKKSVTNEPESEEIRFTEKSILWNALQEAGSDREDLERVLLFFIRSKTYNF